jgi:hypothetical protein
MSGSQASNTLLRCVRATGIKTPCIRVYTTAYKAGGCRVKFYGMRKLPRGLVSRLRNAGIPVQVRIDNGSITLVSH